MISIRPLSPRFLAAAALVVVASAVAAFAPSALAATGLEPAGSFASGPGAGDGQLDMPKRVAVESSTGNVLVVDQNNDRVQVFEPAGNSYLAQFGAGVLDDPFGVAIDQDSGDVYVSSAANGQVVKFNTDGAATPTYTVDAAFTSPGAEIGSFAAPLAFDQPNDRLLVADPSDDQIERYTETGTSDPYPTTFDGTTSGTAFTALKDIATDDDGDVLAVDGERIERFAANATHTTTLTGHPATPDLITAIPDTNEVLVAHNGFFTPGAIYRFDGDQYADSYDGGAPDALNGILAGLAIRDGDPRRLYIATDALFGFFGAVGVRAYEAFTVQPPLIAGTTASPGEVGARLGGSVDPNRVVATYHFEYGETVAYGRTYPATPTRIAAGNSPVTVSRVIGGLRRGTTYHYRLVATNAGGTTEGPDAVFTTKLARAPGGDGSPGRAYEQVTPVDKRGVEIETRFPATVGPEGNAIAYTTLGSFPGADTSVSGATNISTRGPNGWLTTNIDVAQLNPGGFGGAATIGRPTNFLSADFQHSIVSSGRALTPGATEGGSNIYKRDTATGALDLLYTTPNPRVATDGLGGYFNRMDRFQTADLSHVVFQVSTPLSALLPGGGGGGSEVYEIAGTDVRHVGVLPDGTISPNGSAVGSFPEVQDPNPISADGRRIFFRDGGSSWGFGQPVSVLYMREDGETVPVSVSQRSGEVGELRTGEFKAASEDGSVVYFWNREQLVNEMPPTEGNGALYRYDVDSREMTPLIVPLDGGPGAFERFYSASADGSVAVFVSSSRLTPDAEPNSYSVYMWRDGDVERVANIGGDFGAALNDWSLSPNGRYFAFTSAGPVTDYDNADPSCGGMCREVYRYDSLTHDLACLSCDEDTSPDNGHSSLMFPEATVRYTEGALDDGRVFFDSAEALVSSDSNGKLDVYEWADGEARLVSSGRGSNDSTYVAASADGRDVFFHTAERLVAQDTDNTLDLYNARVGGGIPAQDQAPATGACDGDACQGTPGGALRGTTPASDSPVGRGNARGGQRASFAVPGLSAKQRAALARGRTVALRVRVNRAGRVTLTARAKIGGRTRGVGSSSALARRAGAVTLRLRLSRPARRHLTRSGALNVALAVRFAGARESRDLTLRLKRSATTLKAR